MDDSEQSDVILQKVKHISLAPDDEREKQSTLPNTEVDPDLTKAESETALAITATIKTNDVMQEICPATTPIIICDAWYGFPAQKRPRQERTLAVSRQIYNYIVWNDEYLKAEFKKKMKHKIPDSSRSSTSSINMTYDHILKKNAIVFIIGKAEDVDSIQERVERLLHDKRNATEHTTNTEKEIEGKSRYIFLPGKSLEDLCEELITSKSDSGVTAQNTPRSTMVTAGSTISNNKIAYLSPDAEEILNPNALPPSIVIVGMLVDRKVQHFRSKTRAEHFIIQKQTVSSKTIQGCDQSNNTKLNQERSSFYSSSFTHESMNYSFPSHFQCARLPLDVLNVSDLGSDEALNIDTVLEMIQRWWYSNSHDIQQHVKVAPNDDDDSKVSKYQLKLFKDSACRALLTHRNRHPRRTKHCPP